MDHRRSSSPARAPETPATQYLDRRSTAPPTVTSWSRARAPETNTGNIIPRQEKHGPTYGDKLVAGPLTMTQFVQSLKAPRKILILVKAGGPTDATIEALKPLLEKDDVIVDTGNAHFRDQSRRAAELEALGLRFLGMGISGGEEGARKGPAFFPGGTLSVWEEIKPIVEAASAKADADGLPCVTMCGHGGAGSMVSRFRRRAVWHRGEFLLTAEKKRTTRR